MEMKCKIVKKEFTTETGEKRPYYVLAFEIIDGSILEIPVKGDKAKLLLLNASIRK